MLANVPVVMTVFPALFAAALALGSHIAAESLSPPKLWGSRRISRAATPILLLGWWLTLAVLLLTTILFGAYALFA